MKSADSGSASNLADSILVGIIPLSRHRPLDGAMGTELLQGIRVPGPHFNPSRWCLENPEAVRKVHRASVEAGAQLLTTNTLLAWAESDAVAILSAGVALARETAPNLSVAVSLGPGASREQYASLASIAVDSGADLIQLETFVRADELIAATEAVANCGLPVIALLVPGQAPPFQGLRDAGASLVGFNCAPPDVMEVALSNGNTSFPILLRSSAGIPRPGSESALYDWHPTQWADAVYSLSKRYDCLLGGCCGVGPAHIRALAVRLSRDS